MKKEFSREDYVESLRLLAGVLENNPDIPLNYSVATHSEMLFCHDSVSWHAAVKAFGSGAKDADEDTLGFRPDTVPWLKITGFKNVLCERVVIGTEIVPEKMVPATEASVTPSFEREIVEWKCKPFTAAPHQLAPGDDPEDETRDEPDPREMDDTNDSFPGEVFFS
jgi:hypothetical protein